MAGMHEWIIKLFFGHVTGDEFTVVPAVSSVGGSLFDLAADGTRCGMPSYRLTRNGDDAYAVEMQERLRMTDRDKVRSVSALSYEILTARIAL